MADNPPLIRVSLKDLAAKAGVHYSTVSLALRNSPKLPRATRERIQSVAEEMGYRPDATLSALNAYRRVKQNVTFQATLALLSDYSRAADWRVYHTGAAMYRGIKAQAERQGYQVEEFSLGKKEERGSRLAKILHARNITGLLFTTMKLPHTIVDMQWERFSCVSLGFSLESPDFHRVASAHYRNAFLCMTRLRELGYRRIGFAMLRSINERVNRGYSAAYDTALRIHPELEPVPLFTPDDYLKDYTPEKIMKWIRKHRVEAILTTHEGDLIKWLPANGLQIPEGIGVVNAATPSIDGVQSGVFESNELIGRTAVNLLVGMLHRDERGLPETTIQTLVDGHWVPGKTLRPQ